MKTRKSHCQQLKITILKQGTASKKVLSCSFFTSKEAYRYVGGYQKNLERFLYQKNRLKGFETRIYTDDSGKEFALQAAEKDPTVSVYHYNFPPLRETVGHTGTFGTLVRFLPLFEPGLDTVWVSDIDVNNDYLDPSLPNKAKAAGAAFCYRTFVCYDVIPIYARPYTILAGTMISFQTFPKQLFTKFLNQLVHPTKVLEAKIDLLNKELEKREKPASKIPYGIDEVFINTLFYDYLIKHSIRCYILKDYMKAATLLFDNKFLTKEEDTVQFNYSKYLQPPLFHKLKQIFKKKLHLLFDKYPCLQEMSRMLDSFKTSFVKPLIKTGPELEV